MYARTSSPTQNDFYLTNKDNYVFRGIETKDHIRQCI